MKRSFIILLFSLICSAANSQRIWATLAPVITNRYPGSDLQAGFAYRNAYISGGYILMIDASQPILFNIRGGYLVTDKLGLHAGYVRVTKSVYDIHLNYNTWQAGFSYHFWYYDKTTFFITASYSPKYITGGVGMSYNLVRR